MKTPSAIIKPRPDAGIMLVQCLVYIAVFTLLSAVAFDCFYKCWNHTEALVYATGDITSALHAGERWRADVRSATGKITVQTDAAGEQVRLIQHGHAVVYSFASGEVRRQIPGSKISELLVDNVKASQIISTNRSRVAAWSWDLELTSRRPETRFPMLFTFEAAQLKP